jgi:type IV secretory pathway VirB10-like protein
MKADLQTAKLELKPNPSIIKINRLAFLLVCFVIMIIVGVLAYSIGRAGSKVNDANNDVITQNSMDETDNNQQWFSTVSDEVPHSDSSIDKIAMLDTQENFIDKETLKKRAEALRSALESSIKVSNIGANVQIPFANSLTSGNDISPARNQLSDKFYANQNDPNMQSEKMDFLQDFLTKSNPDYLHEVVKKPLSPYEVKAGTIIPAVISGGINSDLPGQSTAFVSQNVYDSVTGRYLLIPQGSKLILQYDSRISYGQMRLLVGAKRLIFPNGDSLDLQGMPASDSGGYSGLYDEVDNHYARIFGSSAMMGLITGGFELSQPAQSGEAVNSSTAQVLSGALGQQMGQVTTGMMNKNLDIQPTIKIHPGYEFNVTVTSDLIFPGIYRNSIK